MSKILGLDIGTNSIGWALVKCDFDKKEGSIIGLGSRIIPMSQDILGEFGKGNSISQTAERTKYRITRRLRERYLLRRERLHRVLNILGFLPNHYADEIDFESRLGKFFEGREPKLAYHNKQFIFKKSFEEMLADFRQHQPQILKGKNGEEKLVPYGWTIYYLRKKALAEKIEKEELAWVILNFNQKRGYYQRGEDEEVTDKRQYVISLKPVRIEKGEKDKKNGKKNWYTIILANGWTYTATFYTEPSWLNIEREFLVTEELDENGNVKISRDKETDKVGKEKRKITPLPSFEEIDLMDKNDQDKIYKKIKAKTEITISKSNKTVGAYIYDTLLQKPQQKIRGKLVRTIERKFYKEELEQILNCQRQFYPELQSEDLFNQCIQELYRNNEAHRSILGKKDFTHLFVNDIILYQRPLKSKKSSIGNCTLEYRVFKNSDGNKKVKYLKAISKSHPLYQEFRLWQWLYNLAIYRKDDDVNVTRDFLNSVESYENLFDFLNARKEIEQKHLIKYFLEKNGLKGKILNSESEKYRWNYVEDKKYPCNETKALIITRLEKVVDVAKEFLTQEIERQLWHILYSVKDKVEYEKALASFAVKYKLHESSFVEVFKKFPPFENDYGSFSEKAIKKLLPLMRLGKFWRWDDIDKTSRERIEKIVTGEFDETIKAKVREKAIHLSKENHFQGLQLWLASYVVYGRHSEGVNITKWNSFDDLKKFLDEFRQHSLRNPIVEQVITETLRVVADIWQYYGDGTRDFFDEIHIELGREMKNPAEDRKRITNQITENENTNLRIKALLAELKNDIQVENVRPYSPVQQEILKIYEEGILNSDVEIPEDIEKISKMAQPSKGELMRYKLWLEQKYRSPYTGEIIPLSRLFTLDYEIEHVIPQSLFFDDSLSNKVLCEASVNTLKRNQLGLEFIKRHHGEIVEIGFGRKVKIFSEDEYKGFVKQHYTKNRSKHNKLLMEDVPEKMVERQMNDTRYISKFVSHILSNIVRSDKDDDGINSKNVVPGNGKITVALKQDWGLNDIWNELILPRFERLNRITNSEAFTAYSEKHQKMLPTVPLALSKGFQKKRIDHRHHALDALIIACATRSHVNYMNNQHALGKDKTRQEKQSKREDLRAALCVKKYNEGSEKNYKWEFEKPWATFTEDARTCLESIVVSFKQNLRIINKATNYYERWIEKDGVKGKVLQSQNGINWAVRKPMHKETVSGKIELPRIEVGKGKILTATRKSIDTSFDLNKIESVTDTGIQKILKNYLLSKGGNPQLAFSPEGIEDMNKSIEVYNDNKPHQPIHKVRIFEVGSKFPLGQSGNKKAKYVEAAQNTNLFFAIYQDDFKNRTYQTVPLNEVIERQKQGLTSVPEINAEGKGLLFHLSPNDLVYVPTEDERRDTSQINFSNLSDFQKKRLYNVNDFSSTCYFTPNRFAKSIAPKEVDMNFDKKKKKLTGSFDTKTASLDGVQIKDICVKLKIDRLGNIAPVL